MDNIKSRLSRIEKYTADLHPKQTTFILENGKPFHTDHDALGYIIKFGTVTPTGERIVKYPYPALCDPLSQSLYELINEMIVEGRLVNLEPSSDYVG